MGLDSYAKEMPKSWVIDDFNYKQDRFHEPHEIAYWRKHWDLHNFFLERYTAKGGTKEFNCVAVRIEENDLNLLEKFVTASTLQEAFDHPWSSTEEVMRDYTTFIKRARDVLAEDNALYFYSWY